MNAAYTRVYMEKIIFTSLETGLLNCPSLPYFSIGKRFNFYLHSTFMAKLPQNNSMYKMIGNIFFRTWRYKRQELLRDFAAAKWATNSYRQDELKPGWADFLNLGVDIWWNSIRTSLVEYLLCICLDGS